MTRHLLALALASASPPEPRPAARTPQNTKPEINKPAAPVPR